MQDDELGKQLKDFLPEACQQDHPEIAAFMCLACSGATANFILKAEATQGYVESVHEMMEVQEKSVGILRTPAHDLLQERALKGYVKVCASWVQSMWKSDIASATDSFDNCGVYVDSKPVPFPSKNEKFKSAMSFMEWYGVPLMKDFGLIIIDDSNLS